MRSLAIGPRTLVLEFGDITRFAAEAIGNAANAQLAGGGGVDGAIHRAGGPAIMAEGRAIGACPTGSAVVTTAGNLPAKYVIHAVGPIWRGGRAGEPELLASAYRSILALAAERGVRTLALPSISTGVYGYPLALAAPIALEAVIEGLREETSLERVTFILFNAATLRAYEEALEALVTTNHFR
jgi:O-acetyl-ADP-ribose deacetylase (regulator of RNase III)